MTKHLFPSAYIDRIQSVDFEKLYQLGYRGILLDIDNTLVYHGDDSTDEIDALFRHIHRTGLKTIILSDNTEERVKRFLKNIDSPYISDAGKPGRAGYMRAIKRLGIDKQEAVMIGDQIFTDILGANRCGIDSILVQFLHRPEETRFGKRRAAEALILRLYKLRYRCGSRIGDIRRDDCRPREKKRKLFCELHPACYRISLRKEQLLRHLTNAAAGTKFASVISKDPLPNLVYRCKANMIKTGAGIDSRLQLNKAENIRLAAETMDGLLIRPGETFSFWKCVGRTTRKKGYKEGRELIGNRLVPGLGGGLCNLANMIHVLVLHSPLEVTEFHSHSDALAPDHGKRIPFSAGTSVSYNQIDYRFKNTTDQTVQLLVRCEGNMLIPELRSERGFKWTYEITEEDHHFRKEGDRYFRVSKIYKITIDRATGEPVDKELVLDNHSEVMYDYDLIPKDQIR